MQSAQGTRSQRIDDAMGTSLATGEWLNSRSNDDSTRFLQAKSRSDCAKPESRNGDAVNKFFAAGAKATLAKATHQVDIAMRAR
jgi:hypothetical protein